MEQQTAVEWLIKKLQNRQNGIFDGLPHLSLDEIYTQAKQMEKNQIIDAFDIGCQDENRIGKEYYEEIFGGQGSPDTSPNIKNK